MKIFRESTSTKFMLPYLYISIFYLILHGFLVLNKSYFWDDWIWVLNPNEFRIALDELGVVFFKPFFFELFKQPTQLVKSFVFINYFVGALFFYKSLKILFKDNNLNILFCTLLFIAMPYNIFGRSSLCTAPYSLSFALFFISYFCYLSFRINQLKYALFASILFSTLSFNTTSFLVLYVVVFSLTEILFFQKSKVFFKKLLLISFLIILHAVIFYVVKLVYFPTSGVYSGYNKLDFNLMVILKMIVMHGPFYGFEPLFYSFFGKNLVSSNTRTVMITSSVFMYAPLLWAIYKKNLKMFCWILVSILLILAAVFPYIIVGKQPYTYNWDSRHQLLIPLGTSLWIMFVLNFINQPKLKFLLSSFLVLGFSFGTLRMYLSVQGLRYQELALQEGLYRQLDPAQPASYILLNREKAPGMMSQDWSFYELTGMLYKKTGQQVNPIIMASHYATFTDPQNWVRSFGGSAKRYMLDGAEWKPPFYCIKLIENHHMSETQALIYLFDEYFQSEEFFKENIQKIYKFEKIKATTDDQKNIRC